MIHIMAPKLNATFLIFIRVGSLLFFTPIEAIRLLPLHVRLLFIFCLSFLVMQQLPEIRLPDNTLSILVYALCEFSNGLLLSLGIYAAFAVFQVVGQLLDSQMGLDAQAILNPTDHSHDPLTGRLLMMLGALFFFALGGHRQLLSGLRYSFMLIPPGQLLHIHGITPIIQQFGFMFTLSLVIASPVVFALVLIELLAGMVTRNMPQLNAYFLVLPLKILLGLFLLMILLPEVNPIMDEVFHLCFQSWQGLLS